jgi:hypothetical protein
MCSLLEAGSRSYCLESVTVGAKVLSWNGNSLGAHFSNIVKVKSSAMSRVFKILLYVCAHVSVDCISFAEGCCLRQPHSASSLPTVSNLTIAVPLSYASDCEYSYST